MLIKFCILYLGRNVCDISYKSKFLLSNDLEGISLYVHMNTLSIRLPLSSQGFPTGV